MSLDDRLRRGLIAIAGEVDPDLDRRLERVLLAPRFDLPHAAPLQVVRIALAMVAVLGVIGFALVALDNVGRPPQSTPSPSRSAEALTGLHADAGGVYFDSGPLIPGRYTIQPWPVLVTVTLDVPPGWYGYRSGVMSAETVDGMLSAGQHALQISFAQAASVPTDPCQLETTRTTIGNSVEDLVSALAAFPRVDFSPPRAVTLGGFSGTYLELQVDESAPCEPVVLFGVPDAHPQHIPSSWTASAGLTRIWILDIGGVRYVMTALTGSDVTSVERDEIEGVIDSIRFAATGVNVAD
jgi:hypothetical protein